jgi:hypothetical protein
MIISYGLDFFKSPNHQIKVAELANYVHHSTECQVLYSVAVKYQSLHDVPYKYRDIVKMKAIIETAVL